MTIHKTAAIQAGIMPDFRGAGVVLCRSSQWTAADDSVVSGDTLQMVPIPSGAKILRLFMGFGALPAGFTGEDVGYGGDVDAFFDALPMTGASVKTWPGSFIRSSWATGDVIETRDNPAGFLHTFTADDSIDVTFLKAPTKIPTSTIIKMSIWYKMTGTISDET